MMAIISSNTIENSIHVTSATKYCALTIEGHIPFWDALMVVPGLWVDKEGIVSKG